uniref:Uncharacterized protein n=1 Tax=uncultured marine crenarchaeote E37-7F TaxID=907717 RepID=G9BAP8_9ARCH|nr:hypothetical protein E37-7F_21 [uncultured marine crenarchaeote E37-7F]
MKGGERMLNILVTMLYPLSSAISEEEVAEFDRKFPIPSFMKLSRLGARLTKDGMKYVEIYEVEKGKLEEALGVQYQREIEIMKIVKGYKSHFEILYVPTPSTG